jgi:AcrR family transcriptional regulator
MDPRVVRTRRQVLLAATELLGERGFERLTIDAIAEQSGVARSTIYRHWPSPVELFREAFDALCGASVVPDTGDLHADLLALSMDIRTMLETSPLGLSLPSLVSAAAHDQSLHEATRAFTCERRAVVRRRLEAARERGEVDAYSDLDLAVVRFVGPLFYTALIARDPLDDEFLGANVRAALRELRSPADRPPVHGPEPHNF